MTADTPHRSDRSAGISPCSWRRRCSSTRLIMILPLAGTLQLSLFHNVDEHQRSSSASTISARCSAIRAGRSASGTRCGTISGSSSSTCWCRTRSASLLAALLSSPKLRVPRLLPHGDLRADHAVLRHRRLHLEADPVAALGRGAAPARRWSACKCLFAPWLGKEEYALTALGLISVWQFVGIPMMLIYAALLRSPTR